jgi:hypothetical protein
MFWTITAVVIGLGGLLVIMFAAFVLMTLLEAAFRGHEELDYYDDADDLFDEDHHVRPLLGVVHPKEK